WHLRHLYRPRTEVPASSMPAYPFLFEERRIGRMRSTDALNLPEAFAPRPGYEIVPTPEAKALAAYLLSLNANTTLFSAPMVAASIAPASATNAPAGSTSGTNTSAASTNAAGKAG